MYEHFNTTNQIQNNCLLQKYQSKWILPNSLANYSAAYYLGLTGFLRILDFNVGFRPGMLKNYGNQEGGSESL